MIQHLPVMLEETLASIPKNPKLIIDGTLWHWWHTIAIAEKFPDAEIWWFDIDKNMMDKAKERLKNNTNIKYFDKSYSDIIKELNKIWKKADFVLLDLGVNIEHFIDTKRWFSLKWTAPLDMRFDTNQNLTAEDIINTYNTQKLEEIFSNYAEFDQKKAKELSEEINRQRRKNKITKTKELKNILWSKWLWIKAITLIFQAIRIEVNQELKKLETFLEQLQNILNKDGRCTIMSYHSLEDRLVKNKFKELKKNNKFQLINKKAIKPHYKEIQKNKAARSARLRTITKI